jgi:hypothetical protein
MAYGFAPRVCHPSGRRPSARSSPPSIYIRGNFWRGLRPDTVGIQNGRRRSGPKKPSGGCIPRQAGSAAGPLRTEGSHPGERSAGLQHQLRPTHRQPGTGMILRRKLSTSARFDDVRDPDEIRASVSRTHVQKITWSSQYIWCKAHNRPTMIDRCSVAHESLLRPLQSK